jgi:hypothetical protein
MRDGIVGGQVTGGGFMLTSWGGSNGGWLSSVINFCLPQNRPRLLLKPPFESASPRIALLVNNSRKKITNMLLLCVNILVVSLEDLLACFPCAVWSNLIGTHGEPGSHSSTYTLSSTYEVNDPDTSLFR